MSTAEYTVTGMTCDNCERHVREEVEQVPGVTAVEVDRGRALLTVTTAGAPADEAAVIAAVDEAGYSAMRLA